MPDILPITDTEIDDVIKVAPIEVALDPNKTQGRNHRGLIKKIRDYFVQEVLKKSDKDLAINTQTASYTLALTDRGGMVRMNVASANTLTVPPNSSVAFPIGTQIVWSQPGAGQTTFVAGSGVTVRNLGTRLKSMGQYAAGSLIKVGTNEWLLAGEVVA